jgi:hypothetical protein
VERGGHGASTATFGVLLDEWTTHGERMGWSPKTLHEYRRKIDKQIRPALGAKRLDKLTAHDLDRFYAAQLGTGLGRTNGAPPAPHHQRGAPSGSQVGMGHFQCRGRCHATDAA